MNLAILNLALIIESTLNELTKHVPVLTKLTDGTGYSPNTVKPPALEQQSCLQHIYFPFHLNKESYMHYEGNY